MTKLNNTQMQELEGGSWQCWAGGAIVGIGLVTLDPVVTEGGVYVMASYC
jgi:hypothetical protein